MTGLSRWLAAWRLAWTRCWQCDRPRTDGSPGRFCTVQCREDWFEVPVW